MFIYDMDEIGFVGVSLFDEDCMIMSDSKILSDLKPSLIQIMDGFIIETRKLEPNEYEFYETDEKYIKISVNGVEKIASLKNFYSFPYEKLCQLSQERKIINKNLIISCFLKQSEKVMAIIDGSSKSYWKHIPNINQNRKTLFILTEELNKSHWNYAVTFTPYRKEMSLLISSKLNSIKQLMNKIYNGEVILVNKEEYLQKIEKAKEDFKNKSNKEINRIVISDEFNTGFINISGYLDIFEDDIAYYISDEEIA